LTNTHPKSPELEQTQVGNKCVGLTARLYRQPKGTAERHEAKDRITDENLLLVVVDRSRGWIKGGKVPSP
jgi:hypothetical protein